ncbi:MAG: hypothetical protein HQ519_14325 [Planctomycetes bacterium]|nr:hypothetical protein [Planctomycetota bacterium]
MHASNLFFLGLPLLLAVSCSPSQASDHSSAGRFGDMPGVRTVDLDPEANLLPPPELITEDIFPCSECHDPDFMEYDPSVRELGDPHDVVEFNHGGGKMWCIDCHDSTDFDMLHLSGGQQIEFKDAPQLCGQCHSERYADWQAGVHGKRTGMWNGAKDYQPCSQCHSGHNPHFGTFEPESGPPRPEVTK